MEEGEALVGMAVAVEVLCKRRCLEACPRRLRHGERQREGGQDTRVHEAVRGGGPRPVPEVEGRVRAALFPPYPRV